MVAEMFESLGTSRGGGGDQEYLLRIVNNQSWGQTNAFSLTSVFNADVAISLPFVNNVSMNRNEATVLSWTLGRFPIREHAGIREHMITIRGRSGLEKRLGSDAQGGSLYADGPALFREIEEFFKQYQLLCEQDSLDGWGAVHSATQMNFHCPFENVNLRVEPVSFSWNRASGTSRHSYEYTIQLRSYGEAKPMSLGWLDFAKDAIRATGAFYDQWVTRHVAEIGFILNETNQTLDAARGLIGNVANTALEFRKTIAQVRAIRNQPAMVVHDIAKLGEQLTLAMQESIEAFSGESTQERDSFIRAMQSVGEWRRGSLTTVGLALQSLEDEEPDNGPGEQSHNQSVKSARRSASDGANVLPKQSKFEAQHKVGLGETTGSIAQKYYGSSSDWVKIANANGMMAKDLKADGSPLEPGDVLVIPLPAGAVGTQMPTKSPFGVDLAVNEDGDLVLSGTGDVALVSGVSNMEQALRVRILTDRGTVAAFPEYGMPRVVSKKNTLGFSGTVQSAVYTQVISDPRVESVGALNLLDGGDNFVVRCVAKPYLAAPIEVFIPVESSV